MTKFYSFISSETPFYTSNQQFFWSFVTMKNNKSSLTNINYLPW